MNEKDQSATQEMNKRLLAEKADLLIEVARLRRKLELLEAFINTHKSESEDDGYGSTF